MVDYQLENKPTSYNSKKITTFYRKKKKNLSLSVLNIQNPEQFAGLVISKKVKNGLGKFNFDHNEMVSELWQQQIHKQLH